MDYYELLQPEAEPADVRGLPNIRLKNELIVLTERLNLADLETAFHIMKNRCNSLTNPRGVLECHLLRDSDLLFLKSLLAYGFGIF